MKKIIGIYKITNPKNKIYIGQSIDINKRFNQYRKLNCKLQNKLFNSLKKYGVDKHKFEIICECDVSELNELERMYQDLFSAINENSGLNLVLTESKHKRKEYTDYVRKKMSDSLKGRIITEEHKRKIQESRKWYRHTEETKLKMSKPKHSEAFKQKLRDRTVTNETKEKIRAASTGKKHSEESKNKISIANKGRVSPQKGKKLPEYIKEIAIKNLTKGIFTPEILRKMSLSHTGRKHPQNVIEKMINSSAKSKLVLDLQTGIFYNSATEAAELLGIKKSTLRSQLNGHDKNKTSLIYA